MILKCKNTTRSNFISVKYRKVADTISLLLKKVCGNKKNKNFLFCSFKQSGGSMKFRKIAHNCKKCRFFLLPLKIAKKTSRDCVIMVAWLLMRDHMRRQRIYVEDLWLSSMLYRRQWERTLTKLAGKTPVFPGCPSISPSYEENKE